MSAEIILHKDDDLRAATQPPKMTPTERGVSLWLPNGTVIDPATPEQIAEAKAAWMTDMDRRFALDLRLRIIEKKSELKSLQLRMRAEMQARRTRKPAQPSVERAGAEAPDA